MINNEFQLQFFCRDLLILTSLSLIQISSCRMRENCKSRIYLQYQARRGTVCMPIVKLGLPSDGRSLAHHKFCLPPVSLPGWFSPVPPSPCLPHPSSPRPPRPPPSSASPTPSVWPGTGPGGSWGGPAWPRAWLVSRQGWILSSPMLEWCSQTLSRGFQVRQIVIIDLIRSH